MRLIILGAVLGAIAYGALVPNTFAQVQEKNRAWCLTLQHNYASATKPLPDTASIGYCAKLGVSVLH